MLIIANMDCALPLLHIALSILYAVDNLILTTNPCLFLARFTDEETRS